VTGLHVPLTFVWGPFGYVPEPLTTGEDLFRADATITVTAPGDVAPAFSATLTGVPPLVMSNVDLDLVDGRDQRVTWTAENEARIQLAVVVGWHGAAPEAMMVCETEDDGELTIPGGLIAELPHASADLEQHLSSIQRFRRAVLGSSATATEIVVASRVVQHVSHK